jgi:uncharacterized membrane protein
MPELPTIAFALAITLYVVGWIGMMVYGLAEKEFWFIIGPIFCVFLLVALLVDLCSKASRLERRLKRLQNVVTMANKRKEEIREKRKIEAKIESAEREVMQLAIDDPELWLQCKRLIPKVTQRRIEDGQSRTETN